MFKMANDPFDFLLKAVNKKIKKNKIDIECRIYVSDDIKEKFDKDTFCVFLDGNEGVQIFVDANLAINDAIELILHEICHAILYTECEEEVEHSKEFGELFTGFRLAYLDEVQDFAAEYYFGNDEL